MTGKIH